MTSLVNNPYADIANAPEIGLAEQIKQQTERENTVEDFETISFNDLMDKQFAELWQPVNGIITEGLTVLVGGSKLGKSWIALDLAYCVATGRPFWGQTTQKCPVLYLALEDSQRRIKDRYNKMNRCKDNATLEIVTKCRNMDNGFDVQISNWIQKQNNRCLVIVDVLQKIRGIPKRSDGDAYQVDYRNIGAIKALADKYGAAFVVLHHTNKGNRSTDRFDRISGSTGIMGVADTAIIITRERNAETAEVDITGRDIIGGTFNIRLDADTMHWDAETEEATRRRAYENNEAVRTIKALIAENPAGGKISYGDFRCRCLQFPYRDGTAFANALKKGLAEDLYAFDGIIVTTGVQKRNADGSQAKGIEYYLKQ